ncbi:hypothetical protein SDC9_180805 [bioreactor metagenome]|uniref:Uncharacterized protein n=1 Tax=bioreactor metagenome TaxID=1076179 RepID=A0A645H3P2_9ZZZZ
MRHGIQQIALAEADVSLQQHVERFRFREPVGIGFAPVAKHERNLPLPNIGIYVFVEGIKGLAAIDVGA